MIPYFAQPRLSVAGHTFYAFGFLAAIALILGWWMVMRRAEQFGLDRVKAGRITVYMLGWGYYGSHVLYLLFFQRAALLRHPWRLLNPLDGIYSFGGIVCGVLTVLWFARRYRFTRKQVWRYFDVAGFVFPFCWVIARAGCALAHDHVGKASMSWIAVRFPSGARLDLGLIEMLFTAALAIAFLLLDRWSWPAPFFFGLFFFAYGPFRVWLDTLRAVYPRPDRLFGWGSLAFGLVMLFLAWRHRSQPSHPSAGMAPGT